MSDHRPEKDQRHAGTRRNWLILVIVFVLIVDYATILRIEIFDEMRAGRSALEAVLQGNLYLTALGIFISVIGVAWILYLLSAKQRVPGA